MSSYLLAFNLCDLRTIAAPIECAVKHLYSHHREHEVEEKRHEQDVTDSLYSHNHTLQQYRVYYIDTFITNITKRHNSTFIK